MKRAIILILLLASPVFSQKPVPLPEEDAARLVESVRLISAKEMELRAVKAELEALELKRNLLIQSSALRLKLDSTYELQYDGKKFVFVVKEK